MGAKGQNFKLKSPLVEDILKIAHFFNLFINSRYSPKSNHWNPPSCWLFYARSSSFFFLLRFSQSIYPGVENFIHKSWFWLIVWFSFRLCKTISPSINRWICFLYICLLYSLLARHYFTFILFIYSILERLYIVHFGLHCSHIYIL